MPHVKLPCVYESVGEAGGEKEGDLTCPVCPYASFLQPGSTKSCFSSPWLLWLSSVKGWYSPVWVSAWAVWRALAAQPDPSSLAVQRITPQPSLTPQMDSAKGWLENTQSRHSPSWSDPTCPSWKLGGPEQGPQPRAPLFQEEARGFRLGRPARIWAPTTAAACSPYADQFSLRCSIHVTAPLEGGHGTLGCEGTPVENH